MLFFDEYLRIGFEKIPLCRAFINGIFYANCSLSEKINLIWDTLIFFENISLEYLLTDSSLEADTIYYFMRTICNICWPGLPKNSVENIVDLYFHGRIATIEKAWFISPGKVRDFTSFFQSALNHIHLATGKKELDFSNTDLVKTFARFIKLVDN